MYAETDEEYRGNRVGLGCWQYAR
ncbi:unnamed protein product, partial [Rotaria magnacalcarata]